MTVEELRKLDAEVHKIVMGREYRYPKSNPLDLWWENDGRHEPMPRYSANIAAAWAVLDGMRARGYTVTLEDHTLSDSAHKGWWVIVDFPDGHDSGAIIGATAPIAICLAALKTVSKG